MRLAAVSSLPHHALSLASDSEYNIIWIGLWTRYNASASVRVKSRLPGFRQGHLLLPPSESLLYFSSSHPYLSSPYCSYNFECCRYPGQWPGWILSESGKARATQNSRDIPQWQRLMCGLVAMKEACEGRWSLGMTVFLGTHKMVIEELLWTNRMRKVQSGSGQGLSISNFESVSLTTFNSGWIRNLRFRFKFSMYELFCPPLFPVQGLMDLTSEIKRRCKISAKTPWECHSKSRSLTFRLVLSHEHSTEHTCIFLKINFRGKTLVSSSVSAKTLYSRFLRPAQRLGRSWVKGERLMFR